MVDQSEMYGSALRLHGSDEERHVAQATYAQARSALLEMIAAALGEAEIVDLIDDRVMSYFAGPLTEIRGHFVGGGNPA